jgi:alkaline phosphatase D
VIAQQVFLARRDFGRGPAEAYNMDAWDGYLASRQRLMSFLAERRPTNPVVITGDVHENWVADLKADFTTPSSTMVGTEFVGTSISSGGDGTDTGPTGDSVMAETAHIKFYNAQRGYVRCRLSHDRWQTDFRVVPYVSRPGAPIVTRATFVVEDGQPGAELA